MQHLEAATTADPTPTRASRRLALRPMAVATVVAVTPLVLSSCGSVSGGTVAGDVRSAAAAPTASSTPNGSGKATTAKPTPTLPPRPTVPEESIKVSSISPSGKGPYGVGTVITVDLSRVVARSSRKAVQERLSVTTNKAVGTTSWTWLDEDTLAFRPKTFWPAGVTVTVRASIGGLRLGKNPDGVRLLGVGNKVVRFTIGRSMITKVDGSDQMATVVRNGKVVRNIPVSMGKSGWRTRNGVKTVMDFELNHVYTNTSVGDFTESYRLVAAHNLRLTWSGEFFHSAPWASGRLGSYPGSHGCTNASNGDARWMYNNALVGDPMVYVNTGGPMMEVNNGLGGPWNIPWKTWVAKSAAKAVPTYVAPKPKPVSPTPGVPTVKPTPSTSTTAPKPAASATSAKPAGTTPAPAPASAKPATTTPVPATSTSPKP